MATCDCGHTHCCHKERKIEIIQDKNEFGFLFKFERTTCQDCPAFLGDKKIE